MLGVTDRMDLALPGCRPLMFSQQTNQPVERGHEFRGVGDPLQDAECDPSSAWGTAQTAHPLASSCPACSPNIR